MLMIPAPVMPFRMIRAIDLVLRSRPTLGSREPKLRAKRHGRHSVRSRLRPEARVLLPDLLNLLRIRLLPSHGSLIGRARLRN
jgi:hypothetical protein